MKKYIIILLTLFILVFACVISGCNKTKQNYYEITQYGMDDNSQAMFYTIKSPDGKLAVIDGGTKEYADYVRQVLLEEGNHVDVWILTHAHEDHMGAFVEIYKNPGSITINEVYTIDIDYDYYAEVAQPVDRFDIYEEFLKLNIPNITYLSAGDSIDLIGLNMEVFNGYSDLHKNKQISGNLMNECSMVFKVTNNKESLLFCADTGDITVLENILREYGSQIAADYMQVGHHGASYNKEFFETVGANVLFIDAPLALREWKDYPVYTNLEILNEEGYEIYTYETTPNTILLK